PDVDARADFHGCLFDCSNTAAEGSRDGVVGVNLSAGADIAMVPDTKTALTIEDHVRANPAMLPYFDIAEDQDVVVTGRTLAESIVPSNFPSIRQKIADRHM